MKLGLCTISGKKRPVDEVLELASEVDYDGVEIWGHDHVGDGSPDTCRQIAGTAAERDLEIPVYGSYLLCGVEEFDETLDPELAIADELGANLIRVWAGIQEYGDHTNEHWKRVIADLERVTDRASEYGISVTVAKHKGTLTNTRESTRRLIEAVDDDRCRLNYQPGFSKPANDLKKEAADLAPLSNHVHLQAVPDQGAIDRSILSAAYFDVAALLKPFDQGEYAGYVNVEFVTDEKPYIDAIEADLKYLRSVLA